MAKVKDAQIWELGFNLDIPPFNMPKHIERIKELLPSRRDTCIRFLLTNSNPAIANAIRRTTLSELRVKALGFDISKIKTNDKEIIPAELYDRISLIPLDQSVPLDAVFSLAVHNDSVTQSYKVYYTSDLVQTGGTKLKELPFTNMYRIAEVRPGRFLEIPHIYVEEGYCFQEGGAKFSATSNFKYEVRDYMDVNFLNERGNIVKKMVSRDELLKLLPAAASAKLREGGANGLYHHKILVIPNKNYLLRSDTRTKKRITNFNDGGIIIENPASDPGSGKEADDKFLHEYQSQEANPTEYFMEFITHGNISPDKLMQNVCDNLIERLTNLQDEKNIKVNEDEEKTQIMIRGEDHTIPYLLAKTIFNLDPNIGLVNVTLEHPQIRLATINIKHSNPIKIFGDAIVKLIEIFADLKTQFNNIPHKGIYYLPMEG